MKLIGIIYRKAPTCHCISILVSQVHIRGAIGRPTWVYSQLAMYLSIGEFRL